MMTCASNSVASIFEETVIGTPNLDRLYDRVSEVVRMNPWLTCRLRMATSGIKAVYGSEFVDCFQAISRQMKIDIAGKSYSDLVSTLVPYTVKSGESCVDKDEPLFKVTVISGVSKEGPLKQLCLIMSISAVIADARTLYSLFSMMDPDTRPFKLEIARSELYMKTVKQVLGSAQMRWLKSPAMYLGEILKSWTARSQHSAVYTIRNDWIKEKKEQWQGSDVGYVSTNDILTSWFMNLTKCDFGFININFRHLLDLHALQENELLAGRYVHHILLRKPNFETPVAVRNSIPTVENKIKCQPDIPNFMTTIGRNSCLVTNYASISPIVNLPGCTLQLHIPILIKEKDRSFEQYSRWNTVRLCFVPIYAGDKVYAFNFSRAISRMKWSYFEPRIPLTES